MSLRVPSIYKLEPTSDEILLAEAYSMAQVQIDILLDKGISADEYGRKSAINSYKAVSYYYFLINYCILARHKLQKQSVLDQPCNGAVIQEEMQIDCVLKSLECIQKRLGINYRGYLLSLFSLFGISYNEQNCTEECQGLGSFMLDEGTDLSAWIIGDCAEVNKVLKGEFKKGEFNVFSFKKPVE
jgi:hypothetical protein